MVSRNSGIGVSGLPLMLMLSCLWCVCFISNINAAETVVYSEGFESSDGNYTHSGTNDPWEWGTPSPGFTLGPDAAHSGNSCWGTDLDDTVKYNANANLNSPAITLPSLGADQVMRVRFFGWIAVDFMADRGQFLVSSDNVNWENKADLLLTMQGGWNEYVFDISAYAGGSIYLRFRCFADNVDNFDPPDIPDNMAGFYVDDIAITVADAPLIKQILTFEGSEDQSSIASCPWIAIRNKQGDFEDENDVYSVARGSEKEYTDFYQIKTEMKKNNDDQFLFKLRETEDEESYTDNVHLLVVDHSANIDVVTDEHGNLFTYIKNDPAPPSTAVDQNNTNVLSLIEDEDEDGFKAYHNDYVDLDFSWIGTASHPILILKATGFQIDTGLGTIIKGQPRILVQTQNISGQWITRNVFYPRWQAAYSGYDMEGLFPYSKTVRLLAISCHTGKYHRIDWAVMSTSPQEQVTVSELTLDTAIRSDGTDVTTALSAIDGNYAHMSTGEEISLAFADSGQWNKNTRNFVIKTKGYYIPNGTYFFYTWDGSNWVLRDGWSIGSAGDQTREFDLSLWLPDPDGEYKVRIWQDFFFDPAAVDYVGLLSGSSDLIMEYATDLRDSSSVLDLLNVSDDERLLWDYGEDWPYRDRWVEIGWTDDFINTPPSTNPVFVTNTGSSTPIVNWTYFDLDTDPQSQYEIEVWSGPDHTGSNLWDPPVRNGTAESEIYAGVSLTTGQQYYASVKAYDNVSWGTWSEAAFTVSSNNPPVAEAGPDQTVAAPPSCETLVTLDGSASYDPDGDTLSFLWTGSFGSATGSQPTVAFPPGTFLVRLIVTDSYSGTGMDSVTITVQDVNAPVPDLASLPQLTGECSVVITEPPTATDSCMGPIVGTTESLLFTTPGTYSIIWNYDDGNGNISTQSQTIVVTDDLAPVPDMATLPTVNGDCIVEITEYPTATDNCSGTIMGTTTDPLTYSQQGTYSITWEYQDANGNISTQHQTVNVDDVVPPVPDSASLPVIQSDCMVYLCQYPTATDNCNGRIVGTTSDPLTYYFKGTYTIHWTFTDLSGNTSTQTQTVIVNDTTDPVPMVDPLPDIWGYISWWPWWQRCYMVRQYPMAIDNCKGWVVGTTSSPLQYCHKGNYVIEWKYNDGNGNITTQTQNVYIR